MRLVIIGTKIVIVPLFTSLLFKVLTLLTSVFDPAVFIFAMVDVTQVSIFPALCSSSGVRLLRVLVWTLLVVKLMTPCFIITVEGQINHDCCIQHRLEALHVCIKFFIVL
jgi:hypothetical protein